MSRTLISLALASLFTNMLATPAYAQNTSAGTNSTINANTLQSGIDLQWMDKNVRPQDDFYQHMSGKWLATAEIPADRGRFGSFDQLRELSEQRSYDIIQTLAANKQLTAGSNQKKIADLFNSFIDEARANELDIKPLQSQFARIDAITDKSKLPA